MRDDTKETLVVITVTVMLMVVSFWGGWSIVAAPPVITPNYAANQVTALERIANTLEDMHKNRVILVVPDPRVEQQAMPQWRAER